MPPFSRESSVVPVSILLASAVVVASLGGCGDIGADGPGAGEAASAATGALGAGDCGDVPANGVCVCENANFVGPCAILNTTQRFYPWSLGIGGDTMSSYIVGSEAHIHYCEDSGFEGRCDDDVAGASLASLPSVSSFWAHAIVGNDRTSSIRVEPRSASCQFPGPGQIAIFNDANFQGDCTLLNRGQYHHPMQLSNWDSTGGCFGLPNDSISSLKWGPGITSVEIYENTFFWGGQGIYTSSQSTLGWMNDRTSSIIVY